MRIAMLLDSAFPPDSRVENEAVSLIEAGHEVCLFSLDYQGDKPDRELIRGIRVYRYKASNTIYRLSALAYTVPFYRQLVTPHVTHFLNECRPDVLHIHDMVLGETGLRVAKANDLPVVLDLHENRPVIMKEYSHMKRLPGKLLISPARWENAQKRLVGKAGKVIVVTEEARDQLIKEYGKEGRDVVVVPNTILSEIYLSYPVDPSVVPSSPELTLLYMGDTGLRRGTDTAIEALAILRNAGHEVRLILVGSNTEDVRLHQLVREFNLEGSVIFEGWQDVSKFPSYTAVSDICLSPLKRNLHHDTTYANKIFQYMAMGKPLVVSDCPAQARVIREAQAGLVHHAGDSADLAAKIQTLMENPGLRKKMGERAAHAVETTWNWRNTSRGLINLYKSLSQSP